MPDRGIGSEGEPEISGSPSLSEQSEADDVFDDYGWNNYEPKQEPYNPSKDRELVRSILAVGSLALVLIEVILFFLVFVFSSRESADIKDLIGIILSPTIAIASAATGFYFGGQK